MRRDLVVVGASAGGIDALRSIAARLPGDFPAAIAAVLHVGADSPGILHHILQRAGPLRAVCVQHREPLKHATIYVPRPDHHLIVEPSRLRSTRGPRENRFRPAIDPLFRSAAQTYGPRVVGVVLTGGMDDGTAGLWAVKQLGGIAVVQDPADAIAPSMPESALANVRVDHCVPVADIPALLLRLVTEDLAEKGGYTVPEKMEIEVRIAAEHPPLAAGVESLGNPSPYACPECHGVLRQVQEGGRVRFRCHTGHAYSIESLIADFDEGIELALWNSVRALQEVAIFLRHLEAHAAERGDSGLADTLRTRAEEAESRADKVRLATFKAEQAGTEPPLASYGDE